MPLGFLFSSIYFFLLYLNFQKKKTKTQTNQETSFHQLKKLGDLSTAQ